MNRRMGVAILAVVALVLVLSSAGQAQAQGFPTLTRHVREVTVNGEAPQMGKLPAGQSMRLVLTLPLRNQTQLDEFLKNLYDPSSAYFHQFLTVEEFTSLFGPTQADYNTVIHFAEANGLAVVGTSRNRLNVDVSGSVGAIQKALNITLGVYQHPTENRTFFAPDREPSPNLSVRLWHIAGLDNYSIPHPAGLHKRVGPQPLATTGSGPSASFLGSDMRAAYYGGSALTGAGQSLGLLEFEGTDLADLTTYYTNVHQTNSVPITLKSVDGTSTNCSGSCDDTEQTLDMTQALGMAPGLSSLVVYVGNSGEAIFNAMATASPLNSQLSSSWTYSPADPNTENPFFQEFAAQGQNLFQAAGDSGLWKTNSKIWPADDVYVTSVGGTDLVTASAGGAWSSETAWVDGGGGISPDKFAIPSWQTTAAAGCSACSKTLRNGPDVSANANFTFYVCADQTTCTANEYGGTSFAAPMWAGYLALINQQSVANGHKTLGFINPLIYPIAAGASYTTDFHDITSGSNGSAATAGYDLATGLGSPNGVALITALAGGGSTGPGFSLSASPSSISVAQGSSGTSTISSAVTGGFNSAIALSASGMPTGVTAGFNPNPITGASSSVLTLTVASTTVAGTYSITVTGTSGSIVANTTVSLTVTGTTPSFTVGASPTAITVARGASGTSTITTTIGGGFNSAITLTASGQGNNQTLTFTPSSIAAPGSGTSTMKVTVGSRASTGNHTITITAKGGGITHTTTVTLTVTR